MLNDRCPVSTLQVDDHVVRLNALIVVGVVVLSVLFDWYWLMAAVAGDFFIRGFVNPVYSPLSKLNKFVLKLLGVKPRPTNAGPKIFAAKIGCMMSCMIALCRYALTVESARILACLMLMCAGLEAFLGICVACIMYGFIFRQRRSARV